MVVYWLTQKIARWTSIRHSNLHHVSCFFFLLSIFFPRVSFNSRNDPHVDGYFLLDGSRRDVIKRQRMIVSAPAAKRERATERFAAVCASTLHARLCSRAARPFLICTPSISVFFFRLWFLSSIASPGKNFFLLPSAASVTYIFLHGPYEQRSV